MNKVYLGDGVYVEVGDGEVVLTTENGISVQNRIVLDSTVLHAFVNFLQKFVLRQPVRG